ncbi:Gfo/Idh/MocA family oxidoreductase [Saprospiraceae bacterium]|nr:Gfo/Idh/MocA family oxidoreductase [Saprospiraceae bacterium]
MIKIVLIGAGQIGSRHLQAMSNLKGDYKIWVVDILQESLDIAKKRFLEMPLANDFEGELVYTLNIEELPPALDFVLITSTASVRRSLIENVLENSKVKYFILEKVLFQNPLDYKEVHSLLEKSGSKAFVNFPRRTFPIYKELREKLPNTDIQITVGGSHWGLACNGLHIIDIITFLCKSSNFNLTFDLLQDKVVSSKRNEYMEVMGTIRGTDTYRNSFTISCYEDGNAPLTISIQTKELKCVIFESGSEKNINISSLDNGWKWESRPISFFFQSQLTHKIIEDLCENGTCELASYEEASKIHLPFINGLIKHFNKVLNKNFEICPIT